MIVLKLGGSVITEKERPETLDGAALDAAADTIADALENRGLDTDELGGLVVVHGGGSFGHPNAEKHGVTPSTGTKDAGEALEIHGAMKTLNGFVLSRFHERGIPALPVHPLSADHRDGDGTYAQPLGQVRTMLGEGFVPVLHGDVVAHTGHGVTVVSGDELVVGLARGLDADRVGLCSTVPGVLDGDEDVVPHINDFEAVAPALGGSDATDVSGGMAKKVETLLGLATPAYVFGPEGLSAFLAGGDPGTRIEGGPD